MRTRKEILIDLARNKIETSSLTEELSHYTWDSDKPLYTINSEDICRVLETYSQNIIEDKILETWANAIECREDLGFESEELQEIINEIANPVLFGSISIEKIETYKAKLQSQY